VGNRKVKKDEDSKIVSFFQDSATFYRWGLKAYQKGDLQSASKFVKRAVDLDPYNEEMICRLASIYTELGKFQKSNELLTYIIEHIHPHSVECYYFLANNYAHLGLFHEAYKHAMIYKEKAPQGIFSVENSDLLEMIEMEEEAEHSDDLIVKQEKARSLLENGQFQESISILKEIIADYPEFWSAYNNLALAYFYLGEVEKAKDMISLVLRKNPGNLHALCNLLVFFYYEGDEASISMLVEKLKRVYPLVSEHQYKLGATFALIGFYPHAFKRLHALYRKGFEGDDTFYYWLAYSSYFIGHYDFAKKIWKKVLYLNPRKEGSEPWNMKGLNEMENQVPERLLSIYFAMKMDERAYLVNEQEFETRLEREAVQYALSVLNGKRPTGFHAVHFAFHVADSLMDKTLEGKELVLFWFRLFKNAFKFDIKFRNVNAWSAAVYYLWMKQIGKNITQDGAANHFNISKATLSKYVRIAKKLKM
jgi:tetratricopeptide (TPR) repeat protein